MKMGGSLLLLCADLIQTKRNQRRQGDQIWGAPISPWGLAGAPRGGGVSGVWCLGCDAGLSRRPVREAEQQPGSMSIRNGHGIC